MASAHETFWTNASFAFVGHSAKKGFPRISYGEAKKGGKKVFAVDPSVDRIDGDKTYPDLHSLPEKVDAAVLEVPREETLEAVRQVADAGIKNVWVHMNRDTPEALAFARERGLNILTGTCAVMYVAQGASYHSIHKWLNKFLGKY
ncbi:MAG: CoA-binding protein [Deltaproteobacteria bacterium]|nr:CoA-binding protein [Deltaproteobacteria bacterium]